MPYIGAKLKEETVKKVEQSLKPHLPSGEFIVAFFKISYHKPLTDLVAITNHRLLAVYVDGIKRNKGFLTEIVADDIKNITTTKLTNTLVITLSDNNKKKIGMVNKEDQETVLSVLKKISGSPVKLDINRKMSQAVDLAKQKSQEQKRATVLAEQNAEKERKREEQQQKEEAQQRQQQVTERQRQSIETENDKWQSIITGKVNKAALREVRNSCRDGEMPEFILGDGINGVLVAFSDRCMVIKKGLGTSFMSSSLGGGRVATFAYRDITGIEYNSGIMTGVLEILTASYTGKTTNSPWAFGNDKSAHESSNTLPWGKIFYNQVRPQIEWLKQKIVEAKTSGSHATSAPQPTNATDELTKLGDLHKQGILTATEFETAKQKIISKI